MVSTKVYVLKHKTNLFGVLHNNRHYVIGFNQHHIKYLMRGNISMESNVTLKRNKTYDVTDEINGGLMGLGKSVTVKDVTIDTDAQLVIEKEQGEVLFDLFPLEWEKFIMYPFDNSLGVVIVNELYKEEPERYVFGAHIVDPSNSNDIFIKNLKI